MNATAKILPFRAPTGATQPVSAPVDAPAFTIDDALELARSRTALKGRTASTLETYMRHWRNFRDFCASRGVVLLARVTRDLILEYAAWLLANGYSVQTARSACDVLGVMLLIAERDDKCASAGVAWRKARPDLPHVKRAVKPALSETQLLAVLRAAQAARTGVRDVTLILLLVDSGLRVSEVCALRVDDVDTKTGAVTVRHGKGDKARMAYIGHAAREAVAWYRWAAERKLGETLFGSRNGGGMLTRGAVFRQLRAIGRAAGVPDLGPHMLRRTAAISWLRNGGDLITLAKMLGHSNLKELQEHYLPIVDDDIARGHEKFGAVDGFKIADVFGLGSKDDG